MQRPSSGRLASVDLGTRIPTDDRETFAITSPAPKIVLCARSEKQALFGMFVRRPTENAAGRACCARCTVNQRPARSGHGERGPTRPKNQQSEFDLKQRPYQRSSRSLDARVVQRTLAVCMVNSILGSPVLGFRSSNQRLLADWTACSETWTRAETVTEERD
ncbi:hypothetical protein BKA81DRAFT_347835 [Phyllosticta paracitricarpa]